MTNVITSSSRERRRHLPGVGVGILGQTLRVSSQLLVVVSRVGGDFALVVIDCKRHERTSPVVGDGVGTTSLGSLVVGVGGRNVALALVDKGAVDGLDVIVNGEVPGADIVGLVAAASGIAESPCADGSSRGGSGSRGSRDSRSCDDDGGNGLSDLHFGG